MKRLSLPQVTLCCIDCTARFPWAVEAVERCIAQVDFGATLFLSDASHLQGQHLPPGVQGVEIEPLHSIEDYSRFVLKSLADHLHTSHVLIVQWDGFIANVAAWQEEFLQFDYIGAPWLHLAGEHLVGNGGFSLRSLRLLRVMQDPAVVANHPEDICICRTYREYLQERGMRFAPATLAERFAVENDFLTSASFGFHSPRHLPQVLDPERTLRLVRSLDGRILDAYYFGTLLETLQRQARTDDRYRAALAAFEQLLPEAVVELGSKRYLSDTSETLCKALIGYGQFSAAKRLLQCRSASRGSPWPDARLWLRMAGRQLLTSLRL